MLEAIFASKLFKDNKYKDKIVSNINDPINSELVKQLRESLDSDAINKLDDINSKLESDEKPDENFNDLPESDDNNDDEDKSSESDEDNDTQTTDIEESVRLNGEPIEAQTALYQEPKFDFNVSDHLDEIKGLLNAKDDTAGVSRIIVKNNELWIYYEDKINLNNVMTPVIEILNAANYSYLEFNRLARTDNAIVFEITTVVDQTTALEGEDIA